VSRARSGGIMSRSSPFVAPLAVLFLLVSAAGAQAADPMFNQGVLHEVRIVMDPADWQALRDNFRGNQYYAANVSIDGEVVQQVGIRSRGKGSRSGEKPGIKIDFNKYVSSQEFHGYGAVQVKNAVQDASFVREPLALSVYEALGIAAPQISFARLTVNDQYWGLYNLVEDVKKKFLKDRFGEDGGNLFKYEYTDPWDFTSKGDSVGAYVPVPLQAETNEDHLDGSGVVAFVKAANELPSGGSFGTGIAAYIDAARFLTYIAAENATVDNDGFVGYAGMNNFYLYQYKNSNRFVIIPWDKNTSFVQPDWPLYQRMDTNVLTRKLVEDPAMKQAYVAAMKRATDFVGTSFLGPKLEAWYTLVREAALTDTKKPFTNDEFEQAVSGLRGIIAARPANIQSQTAGQ
jgi:spore coat protein CotH